MLSWRRFGLGLVVIVVCVAFALKALLLVDATSLWSDELYSVGKSFQLSFMALLAMLSNDTHPPLYSTILWLWGQSVGQNALTLRLLACLAGLWAWWCRDGAPVRSLGSVVRGIAGTDFLPGSSAGFCSPYPVRFAIEGKSYACLVLFVALAWWRRWLLQPAASRTVFVNASLLYGSTVCLAALTQFYGLFLFAAAAPGIYRSSVGAWVASQIWLASSGPEQSMRRRLNPLRQRVETRGYKC